LKRAWWLKLIRRIGATVAEDRPRTLAPSLHAPRNAETLYFEVARKKLDDQLADVKSIDQAFFSYFSIASTILPITAGFISSRDSLIRGSAVAETALAGAFLFYMAIFVVLIWSVRVAKWDSRPLLSQWREVTAGRSEEEMQRWLGDACVTAYENNEPAVENRARRSGLVLWCLAGEASGLTIAVLAPLWPFW